MSTEMLKKRKSPNEILIRFLSAEMPGNGLRLGAGVYELFRTFKMHRAASTIGDAKIRKCRSAAKNVTPKATKDKQALLP